ncbi:hypothetical protein GCM10022255_034350 [Dactylosporangium darangshiense]|uniref:Uncharacterized protein n=1 Tax=Dactylosporangium darangshiense TaxID=579108 RepID=A0ABP8D8I6_9ACTN
MLNHRVVMRISSAEAAGAARLGAGSEGAKPVRRPGFRIFAAARAGARVSAPARFPHFVGVRVGAM